MNIFLPNKSSIVWGFFGSSMYTFQESMFTFQESEKIAGAGKSVSFSFFCRPSKRMYFSYSGCSACVCLLSKTFSVQGKLFHFLSALTSTFACNFRSGDLSALACIQKKIVLPNRCSIGCGPFCSSLHTFRLSKFIFRNSVSTTRGSMYFSYSDHSACVCLLFKPFSIQGRMFHFL